jgi:hypothetical protein
MNGEPNPRSTDLLYHYTDQNGLVGIVERQELWATNLGCLNDLSEFAHGLDYLRSVRNGIIEELLGDRPCDALETKSFKAVFEYLMDEAERRYCLRDPAEYLYVFSLFDSSRCVKSSMTEVDAGDNLQQWRAYSKGGFGYCIGFDRNLLEGKVKELDNALQHTFCGQCMYGDAEKRESANRISSALIPACDLAVAISYPQTDAGRHALENTIGRLGQELEQSRAIRETAPSQGGKDYAPLNRSEARELISGAMSTYFGRLLIDSALMKHAAFSSEREWRVVRLAFALLRRLSSELRATGLFPTRLYRLEGARIHRG